MTGSTSKSLALVISAIKDLQERRGSSSREILDYVSSVCNVPRDIAKRQVLTALKRGTLHGILRETDGHYSLPIDRSSGSPEIASQELGLLDLSCRKRKQQQRKRNVRDCGSCDSKKRKKSKRRSRKRSKSRKMRGCGRSSSSRRRKSRKSRRKRKSRSKYNCDKVSRRKSKKSKGCGNTKRRSKSKRSRKRRGKKSKRPCTCPPKNTNKCTMNFGE